MKKILKTRRGKKISLAFELYEDDSLDVQVVGYSDIGGSFHALYGSSLSFDQKDEHLGLNLPLNQALFTLTGEKGSYVDCLKREGFITPVLDKNGDKVVYKHNELSYMVATINPRCAILTWDMKDEDVLELLGYKEDELSKDLEAMDSSTRSALYNFKRNVEV